MVIFQKLIPTPIRPIPLASSPSVDRHVLPH